MRTQIVASVLVLAFAVAGGACADEGMWTFDHFPTGKVRALYGVAIDQAWLDHVQRSAVRLSTGCSASVVSAMGLVLTNNHCVADCAQNLSSPEDDRYTHGYVAQTAVEERRCAGMQAEILMTITDVSRIVMAAGRGVGGEELIKARTAASSTLEKEGCGSDPTSRCEVVSLYHGGQYKLYKYRKYSDVRLVFCPGVQTAFFGGDPDNFNFPRYDLDAAFVRLYENGQPSVPVDHLTWNSAGAKAGDAVFVAGNPGGTDRQLTVAQLETQRDLVLPFTLLQLSELRGRLIRFGEESAENQRLAQDLLFGLENSYKVYFGRLFTLNDDAFFADRRRAEQRLRSHWSPGPTRSPDPWSAIGAAQRSFRAQYLPYRLLERGPTGSKLFGYARELVRAAAERRKPSAQRLSGYGDSRLALLEKTVLDPQPVERPVEQLTLEFWLTKVREYLTADDPDTQLLLGRDSPEALAAALAQSKLADPAVRRRLWEGGEDAVAASDDPLIRFARKIDPRAREIRSAWDEKVTGPVTPAAEAIAKATFSAYGDTL